MLSHLHTMSGSTPMLRKYATYSGVKMSLPVPLKLALENKTTTMLSF